ncbi:lasso peptide biosynthesis B2 protein [Streptomyces sp. NPDC001985]|uniref:lasso peptide biosynthesis B2 protein n=1 Tax=Streptomyces sp. NPDC001985 TaxID=3154406 RepID=UPI0033248120
MSQVAATASRPSPSRRIPALLCVFAARLLARASPRRIRRVLELLRTGARPASHAGTAAARDDITGSSTLCRGRRHCLRRSLAVALLCRLRGTWPTWCTGVRTAPFAAHAWVEAEGRPVGEEGDDRLYHTIMSVGPSSPAR